MGSLSCQFLFKVTEQIVQVCGDVNVFFKNVCIGVVLGFSYAKSGNLLTPMIVHGLWNSGVLLLLTFLRVSFWLYYYLRSRGNR